MIKGHFFGQLCNLDMSDVSRCRCKICGKQSQNLICRNCFIPFYKDEESCVSFAFAMKIPDFSKIKNVIVLDLFKTSIANLNLSEFLLLKKLRASRCPNLTRVNISKLPNLEVLDLSGNKMLTQILLINNNDAFKMLKSSTSNAAATGTSKNNENGEFLKLISFDVSFSENLQAKPKIHLKRK